MNRRKKKQKAKINPQKTDKLVALAQQQEIWLYYKYKKMRNKSVIPSTKSLDKCPVVKYITFTTNFGRKLKQQVRTILSSVWTNKISCFQFEIFFYVIQS